MQQKAVRKIVKTAVIEKLSHDGRGIARIDGKTTFIDGALTGEQVTFEYIKTKRDFDEGRVLSVELASADRVTPRCEHHDVCGGCKLQHLNESVQIIEKEKLMLDMLTRIGHVAPDEVLPALFNENPWGYRNRARLSVNVVPKKNRVLVGFREKYNPRYVADIAQCHILHEAVGQHLLDLSTLISQLSEPKSIPQIEVAAAENAIALIFRHLLPLTAEDKALLSEFADKFSFRIYLQPKGVDSIHLLNPVEDDALYYSLPAFDIKFAFYPGDFTQVNARLNKKMVSQALSLLDVQPEDVVLDLFCGLGNFSLPLARYALKVIGVEGSDAMVKRAEKNAQANGLSNTAFYAADLTDKSALTRLKQYACNKLLLDPPRTGALEIVESIELLQPEQILYVSCNPATFARDADILVHQKGYKLEKAGMMDMFSHTTHVEMMGLFKKG